jgi:hypothetical protein
VLPFLHFTQPVMSLKNEIGERLIIEFIFIAAHGVSKVQIRLELGSSYDLPITVLFQPSVQPL